MKRSVVVSISDRAFRSNFFYFLQLCNRNLLSFYNAFLEEKNLKKKFNKRVDKFCNGDNKKAEAIKKQRIGYSLDLFDSKLFNMSMDVFLKDKKSNKNIFKKEFDKYLKQHYYISGDFDRGNANKLFSFEDGSFSTIWEKVRSEIRNKLEHAKENKTILLDEKHIILILSFLLPNQREQFINIIKNKAYNDCEKTNRAIALKENHSKRKTGNEKEKSILKNDIDTLKKTCEKIKKSITSIEEYLTTNKLYYNRDSIVFAFLASIRDKVTSHQKKTSHNQNSILGKEKGKHKNKKEEIIKNNQKLKECYSKDTGKLSVFMSYYRFIGGENLSTMKTFLESKLKKGVLLNLDDYIKLNQLDFDIRLAIHNFFYNITPSIAHISNKQNKNFSQQIKGTELYKQNEQNKELLNKFISIRNKVAHNNPIYKTFESDIKTIACSINLFITHLEQDENICRFIREKNNLYRRLEDLFRKQKYIKVEDTETWEDCQGEKKITTSTLVKRWHKPKGNAIACNIATRGLVYKKGIDRNVFLHKKITDINKMHKKNIGKSTRISYRDGKGNTRIRMKLIERILSKKRDKKITVVVGSYKKELRDAFIPQKKTRCITSTTL